MKRLDDLIVNNATNLLKIFFLESGLKSTGSNSSSHGLGHALCVLRNIEQAIKFKEPEVLLPLELRLAALLHDADDTKLFPKLIGKETRFERYPTATKILQIALEDTLVNPHDIAQISKTRIFVSQDSTKSGGFLPKPAVDIAENVIWCISLVSTAENGNDIPEGISLEYLWVRYADRLEALGKIGAKRCYQFTIEHDRPLWTDTTPRVNSRKEIWDLVSQERFETYQKSGSKSMFDHYYDKLFWISKFPNVGNDFFSEESYERVRPLEEILLEWSKTNDFNLRLLD